MGEETVSLRAERVEWPLFKSAQQPGSGTEALRGGNWGGAGAQPQIPGVPGAGEAAALPSLRVQLHSPQHWKPRPGHASSWQFTGCSSPETEMKPLQTQSERSSLPSQEAALRRDIAGQWPRLCPDSRGLPGMPIACWHQGQ